MGCSASRSLASLTSSDVALDQGIVCSTEEYYEQARVMLATIPIRPPIQRRRARSVGMPSSGVWVYWRPGWNESTAQQRTEVSTVLVRQTFHRR